MRNTKTGLSVTTEYENDYWVGSLGPICPDDVLRVLRSDMANFYPQLDSLNDNDFGGKIAVRSGSVEFQQFLESSSPSTIDLLNRLAGRDFMSQVMTSMHRFFLKHRRDGYILYPLIHRIIGWAPIYSTIELSWMPQDSFIVPHTDAVTKLFSGLMFLGLGHNKNLGTDFWESSVINYSNKHLTKPEQFEEFRLKSNVVLSLDFSKSDLYGFIRNGRAWHSVERIKVEDDPRYVRLSVNYNIFLLKPSQVLRVLMSKLGRLFGRSRQV